MLTAGPKRPAQKCAAHIQPNTVQHSTQHGTAYVGTCHTLHLTSSLDKRQIRSTEHASSHDIALDLATLPDTPSSQRCVGGIIASNWNMPAHLLHQCIACTQHGSSGRPNPFICS
jgi:hypothetical protein